MDADRLIANIKAEILNPIIILAFAVALLVFLYGVFKLIRSQASAEGLKTGGNHILWGLIGMAIMASAWGLINLICETISCKI